MQESASARISDFFCAISIHGVFLLLHRSPYLVHPYWRSALPRCTMAGSSGPTANRIPKVTNLDEPHDIMGQPGPVTPLQGGPNLLGLKCVELFASRSTSLRSLGFCRTAVANKLAF